MMPDGKDVVGESPGQLTPAVLRNWCTMVRSEFNARQNRKDAEEVRAASVRDQGGNEADRASGESVPTDAGSKGNGAPSEASLDEYLQAEVAKWARLQQRTAEDIAALGGKLDALTAKQRTYAEQHLKAQRTLAFHLAQEDNGIASEDL
jgi:hypothetical protein